MMSLKTYQQLIEENALLHIRLEESNEVIEAIRSGQVDALIVNGKKGNELYTLKSSDHTYRVFIESMTEGAVTINQEGIILYCNSQFASMVGMPLSKVIGLSFGDFIADQSQLPFTALFNKGWHEDIKGEVLLKKGSSHVCFQISLTMLQLDEGISLSIILTDLTAQKEIQRQLESNNSKLEQAILALELSNTDLLQFASVASHDLQEPLRKIQLFSTLIRDKFAEHLNPGVRDYLDKIISSSNRMKSLIIDILNYSRLSEDSNTFEPTDIGQLLRDLAEDFEIIIQEKNALLIIEDNLPVLEVNPGQIRQVFQNLISNGLKFTREDDPPVIRISIKAYDEDINGQQTMGASYCAICVSDNGIGFDQKYSATIFALFQRLNSKDKFEGTGIGLSIAKKIIDKHHGRIRVSSIEGVGSEFTVILPFHRR